MDQALRILLRRYALSRNTEDAVSLANALLRTDAPPPIEIWSFEIFNADGSNYVNLFLTEKSAYHAAYEWAEEYFRENDRYYAYSTVEFRQNFEKRIEALKTAVETNDFNLADNLVHGLNGNLPRELEIKVDLIEVED